jgi:hypothetical protein
MQTRRGLLQRTVLGASGVMIAANLRGMPSMAETVRKPIVTGPITGGKHGWPFGAYYGDISKLGYVEEEYFIEGEATRFEPVGELSADGRWTIKPASTDKYKTRIVVHRPRSPRDFNGTVIVIWTNVSAGYEISGIPEKFDGFAYVAVSAQPTGIVGYRSTRLGLVDWDPERYGSLAIPDEGVSYDIFTQCARTLGPNRDPKGPDPMGGLAVRKLIATGASQSATRIMAYLNGVQPREHLFDAFIPIVCAGTAGDFEAQIAHPDRADVTGRYAKLSDAEKASPEGALAAAASRGHSRAVPTLVRDDLSTPVMAINTETEAFVYYPRRQPDTDRFRYWEIAGAAHAGGRGEGTRRLAAERDGLLASGDRGAVSGSRRSEVDSAGVYVAAMHHVHNWITGGEAPPRQQPITIAGTPLAIVRDANGNAVGGIRLPELEVPIATYRGMDDVGSIGGQTIPFTPEKIKELYPTHADYVSKIAAAAKAAAQAGVILPDHVEDYIAIARAAPIPS